MTTLKWIFLICIWSLSAQARETLGDFRVTDLYLEPAFYFHESQQGGFRIENSFIGITWRYDDEVSAYFQVGHASLLGKPFYYGAEERELALTQAYGEYRSDYGRVRAGLVHLGYGFEGGYHEDQLPFPRTLLYENHVVPRADIGVTYLTQYNGFYTESTIHNGETSADRDGQLWLTGRWGFRNKYGLDIGFSGITGRTNSASTASGQPLTSLSTVPADFDGLQSSHFRLANLYGETLWERLRIMLDIHVGQIRQDKTERPIRGGHFDLQYNLSDRGDLLGRYDEWDTNTEGGHGIQRKYMLGIALKSLYRNSLLSLFASRETIDDNGRNPVHGVELVWKLTPNF